jgi:hypothetical protein
VPVGIRDIGTEYDVVKKVAVGVPPVLYELRAGRFQNLAKESLPRTAACAIKDQES